ncbi:MAG: S8 family peptidase, partial [Gemmatimonadaceae bacterium]
MAVRNAGNRAVRAPVRIYGTEDSLAVLSPADLAAAPRGSGAVAFLSSDSASAPSPSDPAGARIWRYERRLLPASLRELAPPDTQPARRWIEVRVAPGVEAFDVSLRAEATLTDLVPAAAPTTFPREMYDRSNFVSDPGRTGNLFFVRNILVVMFKIGATQEERQAAIDLSGGEVVGGHRIGPDDGFYIVYIPGDGAGPLLAAQSALRRLPQVISVTPEYLNSVKPGYLKPYDGSTAWREWRLSPDTTFGQNWGLEAVAAPLGWGCSIGDSNTVVATVDQGLHVVADLQRNVNVGESVGLDSVPTRSHGTFVAAILAAQGNDSSQISGMMWRADLRVYEASVDTLLRQVIRFPNGDPTIFWRNVTAYIDRAARRGARVINVSIGIDWSSIRPAGYRPGTDSAAADTARVFTDANAVIATLRRLATDGFTPLIVASAGNYAVDAFYNWGGPVRDTLPNQIILVGASTRAKGLASYSNRGPRVEIAAPGGNTTDRVFSLNNAGSVVSDSGTSFAAPVVAGLAGLILSFDPSLSASEVKRILIAGADSGQRRAGGLIRIANAHESLKEAARRTGAALCGTRIWAKNHTLWARRGTGTEALANIGRDIISPYAYHGGRIVEFGSADAPGSGHIRYQNGTWTRIDSDITSGPLAAGAFHSANQNSHPNSVVYWPVSDSTADLECDTGSCSVMTAYIRNRISGTRQKLKT